jgi:hypothetical protein
MGKRKRKALVLDDDPSVLQVLGRYMDAFNFAWRRRTTARGDRAVQDQALRHHLSD